MNKIEFFKLNLYESHVRISETEMIIKFGLSTCPIAVGIFLSLWSGAYHVVFGGNGNNGDSTCLADLFSLGLLLSLSQTAQSDSTFRRQCGICSHQRQGQKEGRSDTKIASDATKRPHSTPFSQRLVCLGRIERSKCILRVYLTKVNMICATDKLNGITKRRLFSCKLTISDKIFSF